MLARTPLVQRISVFSQPSQRHRMESPHLQSEEGQDPGPGRANLPKTNMAATVSQCDLKCLSYKSRAVWAGWGVHVGCLNSSLWSRDSQTWNSLIDRAPSVCISFPLPKLPCPAHLWVCPPPPCPWSLPLPLLSCLAPLATVRALLLKHQKTGKMQKVGVSPRVRVMKNHAVNIISKVRVLR